MTRLHSVLLADRDVCPLVLAALALQVLFEPFKSLNWIPARSAHRPISPSRASISRTRCPLPSPPIAGLQDISPIVAARWVTRAVLAPRRAEAAAASVPAWPPPTTMTS